MSDFTVVSDTNPLYAELDRLKRERDALADALREYMRAGVGNSTHYEIQSNALNLARAALAQVRK